MGTQIENIRGRTEKNMKSMARDINTLVAIIENRGQLIDSLAREREALEAELEDGDYWMGRHENMVENGGCPVCFRDDESIGTHGHFPGCELAILEAKLAALECERDDVENG